MNVQTLVNLLLPLMEKHGKDLEIRIGDQIQAGPYSHDRVGSVWTNRPDNAGDVYYVILCAEDTNWKDESDDPEFPSDEDELPLLWTPPAPVNGGEQEGG